MYEFRGEGFKTVGIAENRLFKFRNLFSDCKCFIAYQGERFFPVVIYREGQQLNIPAICNAGIHVIN